MAKKHVILNTYNDNKEPDSRAKIINTQDLVPPDNYPVYPPGIDHDIWEDIHFNSVTYNNISGLTLASLAPVNGWGDVAKDIQFAEAGKYMVYITIPWRTVPGQDPEDYSLRLWDLTNTAELFRTITYWGDQAGVLHDIINITNPPVIINVQRFTRYRRSLLIRNGGLSTALKTRTSVAGEINIQKII